MAAAGISTLEITISAIGTEATAGTKPTFL